jgi:hypothetical protein
VLKIDGGSNIAALMESVRGSISSEAAGPQKVDRNDPEHGSDGQSGRGQRAGTACSAREQRWARLLGAMRMLMLLAPLSRDQISLAAACARVIARIPPRPSRVL